MPLRRILIVLAVFLASALIIPVVSTAITGPVPERDFTYRDSETTTPQFLKPLANFDGVHYISIAKEGYGQFQQAFFPLYPITIAGVSGLLTAIMPESNPYHLTGLAISILSLGIGLFLFTRLARLLSVSTKRSPESITLWSVVFLLAYPTSFYFHTVYTESLYLLLSTLFLYSIVSRRWLLATLAGFLAASTRLNGLFILVPVCVALLFPVVQVFVQHAADAIQKHIKPRTITKSGKSAKSSNLPERDNLPTQLRASALTVQKAIMHKPIIIATIIAPMLGLAAYCMYLYVTTGDPLYFFTAQPSFGANRSTSLVPPPQVIYRYIKIFITAAPNFQYFVSVLEFVFYTGAIAILTLDLGSLLMRIYRTSDNGTMSVAYKRQPATTANDALEPAPAGSSTGTSTILSPLSFRLGINLYSWIIIVLPSLTGTLSSIPRYTLVALSLFLFLAEIPNRIIRYSILGLFIVLHAALYLLFYYGFFIS